MNIICYEIRKNIYEIDSNYHQKMSVHPISLIMTFESKNKYNWTSISSLLLIHLRVSIWYYTHDYNLKQVC